MPGLRHPVTVSRTILLHVWQQEGLGDPHPVLGGAENWVPSDGDGHFTRRCFDVLAGLGLANGELLTREFSITLDMLAAPSRELYCLSTYPDAGNDRKFLFASGNREAAAIQVVGDTVHILPIDERHLVEDFVNELPEVPPARVRPLVIPKQEFHDRNNNPSTRRDLFATEPGPVKELVAQLEQPRDAVHQIYVAVAISETTRRRSAPFSVIDISAEGRVMIFTDGQQQLHRLPGTPAVLADTLTATVHAL